MRSRVYRPPLMMYLCLISFFLATALSSAKETIPPTKSTKASSTKQTSSKPLGRTNPLPHQSKGRLQQPIASSQRGYCCADGKVEQSNATICKRKKGLFFESQQKAKKVCDAQSGYCCKDGEVKKETRGSCRRRQGKFSDTLAVAKRVCGTTKGYCCSNGKVDVSTKDSCDRKRGSFFMQQKSAVQQCNTQKGYCCSDGVVKKSTRGHCQKRRGIFFMQKQQAAKSCERQKGYCCEEDGVRVSNRGTCSRKNGKFFSQKALADRACKNQLGDCLVKGALLPRKAEAECKRLRGIFRPNKQQIRLAEQTKETGEGYCCVNGTILANRNEKECKAKHGLFSSVKSEALKNCRASKKTVVRSIVAHKEITTLSPTSSTKTGKAYADYQKGTISENGTPALVSNRAGLLREQGTKKLPHETHGVEEADRIFRNSQLISTDRLKKDTTALENQFVNITLTTNTLRWQGMRDPDTGGVTQGEQQPFIDLSISVNMLRWHGERDVHHEQQPFLDLQITVPKLNWQGTR